MAKVPLASQQAITSVAFGVTTYYALGLTGCTPNATETQMQRTYHTAGTLDDMYVKISSNSVNGDSTFRVRVNGGNGNQVIVVSSSSTGEFEDATNSDSVADGDEINYSLVTAGSSGTITPICIITNFAASSNTVAYYTNSNIASQNFNVTAYRALSDSAPDAGGAELRAQFEFNSSTTIQKLFVYVAANTITTSATTVRTRKNTANGSCSVSINAGSTGIFEDTSNTDSVVSGDDVCFQSVTPNTSGAITYSLISVEGVSTSATFHSVAGNANGSSTTTTNYFPIVGRGYGSNVENSVQRDLRIAGNATNLLLFVSANTDTGTATFKLRKGGVDTALTLSVTTTATGLFEDASNSVSCVATDSLNTILTLGGTGTIVSRTTGLMFTNTESGVKTLNQLAIASVKTLNQLAIASVKTYNQLT